MKFVLSPDVILCDWLDSKHELTNKQTSPFVLPSFVFPHLSALPHFIQLLLYTKHSIMTNPHHKSCFKKSWSALFLRKFSEHRNKRELDFIKQRQHQRPLWRRSRRKVPAVSGDRQKTERHECSLAIPFLWTIEDITVSRHCPPGGPRLPRPHRPAPPCATRPPREERPASRMPHPPRHCPRVFFPP